MMAIAEFILKKSVNYHFIVNKLNYYYTQIIMFKICLPLSMVCKNYNFSVELHTQSLSERKKYIKITYHIEGTNSRYFYQIQLVSLQLTTRGPQCNVSFLVS